MFSSKKLLTLGASFVIVVLTLVTLMQNPWNPVALGQSDESFSVFLPALGSGGESAQNGFEFHLGDQTPQSGTLFDLASLFEDGQIAVSTDSPTAITFDFVENDVVTAQVHLCIKGTCDSALGVTADSSAWDEVASLFSGRGIVVTQEQPEKITFAFAAASDSHTTHTTAETARWNQVTMQCKQTNCQVVYSLQTLTFQRNLRINSFTLVNANTNEDMDALNNSVTLDLAALPPFNVRADVSSVSGGVGSVKFIVNGKLQSIENDAPDSLAGDNQSDYAAWSPQPGLYRIRAVPYTEANGLGQRGREKTIYLTIVNNDPTEPTATNTPVGTATNTPVPTATNTPVPTATNTPVPHDHDDADLFWHAPGAHGDRPAHEHGDAPPQWVLDAGYTPSFTHDMGTPNENMAYWKHTGFKGYGGNSNGVDWYGVFHLDFNPSGHPSRFHSYQMWFRDGSGNVSHTSGWLDFGQDNNTGPNLVGVDCNGRDVRPIMAVHDQGCDDPGAYFESWYSNVDPGWVVDFGFNIATNYYAGGDPNDPTTWTPIESNNTVRNLTRRIEFAWYEESTDVRGEFWATQWGDFVSGPNDPLCGTQRSYGTRSYTVLCVRQYIAPTLTTINFSIQRQFPGAGVVRLPN